jgi:hypothetical protein
MIRKTTSTPYIPVRAITLPLRDILRREIYTKLQRLSQGDKKAKMNLS